MVLFVMTFHTVIFVYLMLPHSISLCCSIQYKLIIFDSFDRVLRLKNTTNVVL